MLTGGPEVWTGSPRRRESASRAVKISSCPQRDEDSPVIACRGREMLHVSRLPLRYDTPEYLIEREAHDGETQW